jgi:hypothetical protein
MSPLPIVHRASRNWRARQDSTCDPRLRRPKARASPGRPKTIRPDFTACFEGGRQLLPTPDHDGVSHLCHTATVRAEAVIFVVTPLARSHPERGRASAPQSTADARSIPPTRPEGRGLSTRVLAVDWVLLVAIRRCRRSRSAGTRMSAKSRSRVKSTRAPAWQAAATSGSSAPASPSS